VVGHDRDRARRTELCGAGRLARDGEHAKALTHQRQQTHADIAAAHDQEARLVEPDIVFCIHAENCMTISVRNRPIEKELAKKTKNLALHPLFRKTSISGSA
jgi:hypothetical protein